MRKILLNVLTEVQAQQVFLNPMFSILTLKTMHGAVQDLQEPNQRLSSIWVLRETALRMRIRNLPASKKA